MEPSQVTLLVPAPARNLTNNHYNDQDKDIADAGVGKKEANPPSTKVCGKNW
jgi:hypothetical protein